MKRLTSKNPLTEKEALNLSLTDLYMRLKAYEDTGLEPEEVRPVVYGEWLETRSFDQYYQPIYECSHCHREVADNFMAKHLFCLHCGADMRPRPEGTANGK